MQVRITRPVGLLLGALVAFAVGGPLGFVIFGLVALIAWLIVGPRRTS